MHQDPRNAVTHLADRSERSGRRRRLIAPLVVAAVVVVLASACVVDGTWAATAPVAVPSGTDTRLHDVACVSDDWCMAVGRAGSEPVVQIWDGTTWADGVAPPTGYEGIGWVESVDCAAPDVCVAVVARLPENPGDYYYRMAWDGSTWVDVPPGDPIDGQAALYSCAPDGACVILDEQGHSTIIWDGDDFTTIGWGSNWPHVGVLDCVSATDCLSFVEEHTSTWDGSTWSTVSTTSPVEILLAIDCPTTDACTGVGWESYANPSTPLGATWDGSTWTAFPLPVTALSYDARVSCGGSSSECVAVVSGGPGDPALQMTWMGSQWFLAPAPPGGTGSRYSGISCVALWCMAVGRDPSAPSQLLASTYSWTNP